MTTETLGPYVNSHILDAASEPSINERTPSGGQGNGHTDLGDSGQRIEFLQVVFFLTFTLRESIQQTIYSFLQAFKCTYLLLRELHKPYLDTVRVLVPLWLTVVHAICLVVLVLVHKITTDSIAQLWEFSAEPLKQFTTWTERHVPRVFRPLASLFDAALSSVLLSGPSSTTRH
jgi:hypothetical protein